MIRAYYSPVRRHFRTSLEGPDGGSERPPAAQCYRGPRVLCKRAQGEGILGAPKVI